MKRVELQSDHSTAANLDRRKHREIQRQNCIFNAKERTIGIDKDALDCQVKERRNKEEVGAKVQKEYEDGLISTNRVAHILAHWQKKDERLLEEAIVHFRHQFQQPSSRRKFDLNDPELLKKQEGMCILPGLTGEDPSSRDRARQQKDQLRNWIVQQQRELEKKKELQNLEDQQYDLNRVALDSRALEMQKMEEEHKRATNTAIGDFNLALAAELSQQREKERHEEEKNNQADILNQLQGEVLRESTQRSVGVPGQPRVRRDCYKGMSPQQIKDYTTYQLQQATERRKVHMQQQQEDMLQDLERLASARAALLQERQQARINKELRRGIDNTNAQLALIQHRQKEHLEKEVYSNVPDESYFSQFNTSSR
ncbi:RIB43A-like with coiled-coils protein 2 [Hoplias malabaricus]|uniref:RIB43A-like with coiled-coils protein 2 n=1 Tax=Hoplias malabaricus TaxID=27720 RepID=UPI00346372DE